MPLSDDKQVNLLEDVTTLKQGMLDVVRRVESYHAAIQNQEELRKIDKQDMKDYFGDKITILTGELKEHINKVNDKSRADYDKKHEEVKKKVEETKKIANIAKQDVKDVKKTGYIFASIMSGFGLLLGWILDIYHKVRDLI